MVIGLSVCVDAWLDNGAETAELSCLMMTQRFGEDSWCDAQAPSAGRL